MRTIIAGSRSFNDYPFLEQSLDHVEAYGWDITRIVSGTAKGADQLGERYAEAYEIPIKKFPADWNTYGKSAGYRRNIEMAQYAEALVVFWDGRSKGTKHMIDIAIKEQLFIKVFLVNGT